MVISTALSYDSLYKPPSMEVQRHYTSISPPPPPMTINT